MDHLRMSLRPLLDTDDLDELHVGAAGWFGEATLRRMMAANNDLPAARVVGLIDGVTAGFANAVGAGVVDGHRGIGHVFVRPSMRGLGLGTLLWREVLAVCTPDRVSGVQIMTGEDDLTSQQVAIAHGLRRAGLHLESCLDLRGVGKHLERASNVVDGVEIRPFPANASAEEWRTFVELLWKLIQDTPDQAQGAEPIPEPVLRSMIAEPWQVMGAWQGEQLVGFTAVFVVNQVQRTLNTFLTALERPHRGQGLSTALKVSHAVALADAGWASIITQNMEGNLPILACNSRLGYKPTGGLRDLVYDF